MAMTDDTRRRWAARVCQLDAWSRELHDQATQCDAALEELLAPSASAEVAFAGTRDVLSFAAQQVDQTAEALRVIVELVEQVAESPSKPGAGSERILVRSTVANAARRFGLLRPLTSKVPEQARIAHGTSPESSGWSNVRSYHASAWANHGLSPRDLTVPRARAAIVVARSRPKSCASQVRAGLPSATDGGARTALAPTKRGSGGSLAG